MLIETLHKEDTHISNLYSDLDLELRKRNAVKYLANFTKETFPTYRLAKHNLLICDYLEQVEKGNIDRLLIAAPPRHGKSELASTRFPVWYLGKHPESHIISCSYSANLASKFGMRTKNIIETDIYQFLFDEVRLDPSSKSMIRWDFLNSGGYVAAGIGGSITGKGADILIIDDPIKNQEEAMSELIRDNVWNWYTSTAYTRLEGQKAVIVIATRWHEDDLIGRLLTEQENGGDQWTLLNLPAIATDGDLFRESGEALWPQDFPLNFLTRTKTTLGSHLFESLYQQNPTTPEGNIINKDWWMYYNELPTEAPTKIVQSLDTAFEESKLSAYSSLQTWYEYPHGYYLVDVWRGRVNFPDLKRKVKILFEKYNPNVVLIEKKASGHSLLQELKESTMIPIKSVTPVTSKVNRVFAISPLIESGRVFVPVKGANNWSEDFLLECSQFPKAKYDDQVDAMSQVLTYLSSFNKFRNLATTFISYTKRSLWS